MTIEVINFLRRRIKDIPFEINKPLEKMNIKKNNKLKANINRVKEFIYLFK